MSSSRKRVCPPGWSINRSARSVRLLLTDLSKVKQSVEGNVPSENRPLQAVSSYLNTENSTVDVKEEFDNGEHLSQPVVIKEEFEVEEELFHQQQLQNSHLNSGQKITYEDPVTLKNGDNMLKLSRPCLFSSLVSPLVPTTRDVHKFSDKLQTLVNTKDVDLPEPDLTSTSLPAAATSEDQTTTSYFPSKIPSSVTLTFDASDEEHDSSQSHEPMTSSSGLQEMEADSLDLTLADKALTQGPGLNFNFVGKQSSRPLLNSETIMGPKPLTSKIPVAMYELPVEYEESETEEDISPRPGTNTSLLDKPNNVLLPVFIQGPQDTMFLEEVSMTIRQFNELLENIFLYHYFQMPLSKRKINLEAVLKFLVRGETIANLAQEYKISKNTFTKYLPEVLGAIFEVLGLLRVKERQHPWIETQKRFTERLGLPNCCGVINAKTIITWRPSTAARLPVLTLTDTDYNILHVDMEAGIEEHGIDFKHTKLHMAIHSGSGSYSFKLPKLGFVVGSEHLLPTRFVLPLYRRVSDDTPIPSLYNKRVERALRVSENAHGILTSKFKIYDKIMTLTPNLAKSVVKATCALHNWLNRTSPGYVTPGLVDVETRDDVALGTWRFAHRQIFQPVPLFHRLNTDRKNRYDTTRDNYACNLYNLEQSQ